MNFAIFILWLTIGAIVGWFANRMVETERKRYAMATNPTSASE